ncbi:MAG: hypothetical protein ACO3JL_11620, partial [Myxococcota bacterium]
MVLLPFSSASAQTFDSSETRSFIAPARLARADCTDPAPVRITLRGSTPAGASLEGYLLEGISGTVTGPSCIDRLTATSLTTPLFSAAILSPAGSFTQEVEVAREAVLQSACDSDAGLRRNDMTICVYMVSSLEDELADIGFFVAIDTQVPDAPTIRDVLPGDQRVR